MIHPNAARYKQESPPSRSSTPIYVAGRDKPIGYVRGGCFRKTIQGSKHLLRVPPAVAFDLSTLDDAERAGAKTVEVTDSESGHVYSAPLALLREKGFKVARGFGSQWALTLIHWAVNGQPSEAEQRAREDAEREAKRAATPVQMGLFAGGAA